MNVDIKEVIRSCAASSGFDEVGFTGFESISAGDQIMEQWVDEGRHGTMQYLADIRKRRERLLAEIPDAKSIIVLGVNYYQGRPLSDPNEGPSLKGRVARYAWGRDYHQVIRGMHERLIERIKENVGAGFKPAPTFQSCVDTQPLPEKLLASRAGLGFLGKHTVLLNPKFGPWLFLSEIVTNLDLESSVGAYCNTPLRQRQIGHTPLQGNPCGSCTSCQTVCPTGALDKDYQIDARKCIAYLTIEHKGVIPRELRPKMKDWIFGCDECLTACPFTSRAIRSTSTEFTPEAGHGEFLNIAQLFEITSNAQYERQFRGSAISRANRKQLLRNACIVLGNSGREEAIPYLTKAFQDPAPLVRLHAAWALGRLGSPRSELILMAKERSESDPEVREEIRRALESIQFAKN